MERHVAEQALTDLFDASRKMNTALLLIQKECPEKEFRAYRTGVGLAMGYLYNEIIRPILREHPDLEPEEMKETQSSTTQTSGRRSKAARPRSRRAT
jgi:hypothetical protein